MRSAAFDVRRAHPGDVAVVRAILEEASRFADQRLPGVVMWDQDELAPEHISAEVGAGLFFIADADGVPAGVIRFQLEDRLFWPDLTDPSTSAFVHRLAVRREYAGEGVSVAL